MEQRSDGEGLTLRAAGSSDGLSLNPSAQAIWELCDGTRTVDQIRAQLLERFRADADQLRRDLTRGLEQLLSCGFVAPLEVATGSGETLRLDLRDIPCFVINCEQDQEKRRRMAEQLAALGMRHEIVSGIPLQPSWYGVGLSHLKILRLSRARTPFLVLEDDCEFNDSFQPVLDVPIEADALYLGVSIFGIEEPGRFGWGVANATQWCRYDESYLRVFNMLARHAVVYLSSQFQHRVVEAQIEALTNRSSAYPGDIGLAMLHASHLVLTPNEPVCYQRDRRSTAVSLPSALPGRRREEGP